MKKRIKTFIVLLLAISTLASCSGLRRGSIEISETSEPIVISNQEKEKIFHFKAQPIEEHDFFYDYHAGFVFPYPKDWEVKQLSSNYIMIAGPDTQLTISHNLMVDPLTESYATFKESFNSTLKEEYFQLDNDAWYRRERQTISSIKAISDNPMLLAETYDNLKVSNSANEFVSGKYCEKRYYINYGNVNTLISVVGKDPECYAIADYAVSNLRTVPIEYDDSTLVDGILLPDTFEKNEVLLGDYKGYDFHPVGSDAYAGCFVQVYSDKVDITDDSMNAMLQNAFGQNVQCGYNYGDELLFRKRVKLDGQAIAATIGTNSQNGDLKNGTAYVLEIYQSDSKTIIVGYPYAKTELMQKLSSLAEK